MTSPHTYSQGSLADRPLHPLAFWTAFILAGIWMQHFAPGVDFLAPALIVCLQQRRTTAAAWLGLLFIVLQEGMGSLAFGTLILWYAGLLVFYLVGRWLFESRNLLFIFVIGVGLSLWRFVLVRMMADLQGLTPARTQLIMECMAQAVVFALEWGLLYTLYKRLVRHDDESRT